MNNAFAIAFVCIKELYRRKDFYVLFVLSALITLMAGCGSFFHDTSIVRYLKELCLLLIWISALIIAVTTAARQIPAEREQRTIFPLLAKPVSRWELILGKFLGCWLATGIALVLFYVLLGIVSASREHTWPLLNYFQALWMQWAMLGIVIAMTILGSIVFAAPSSNSTIIIVVVLSILFIGGYLHTLALGMVEPSQTITTVIYFIIPHLELFDVRDLIVHERALVPWWAVGADSAYAVAYSFFFLFAAWTLFRRKALNT
ncbi:MAG TPA: ABC transporter permease subunit [Verrucomicrobiae bacterium]|jgi:ABC-type transport system involved in multi-copper enzyme maturation permease subunit|nr:ABC transporter permease subunit [Verrucomicrobiae bacterium]